MKPHISEIASERQQESLIDLQQIFIKFSFICKIHVLLVLFFEHSDFVRKCMV